MPAQKSIYEHNSFSQPDSESTVKTMHASNR